MIKLGAPVFNAGVDPDEIARRCREKGYTSAYCPQVSCNDTERLKRIRKAFTENKIIIGEVGCWENMMHPEPDIAKENIKKTTEALVIADEVGALCAVNLAGSMSESGDLLGLTAKNFSREFFDRAVEIARHIIDTVRPRHAYMTFEFFPFNLMDSPEAVKNFIDAVQREKLGVHFDPCNLINCPRVYFNTEGLLKKCFSLFGEKIVACHAKDVKMQGPVSVLIEEAVPGRGNLDYGTLLKLLSGLNKDVSLLLEHLSTEKEYDEGIENIRRVAVENGVSI